MVLGLEIDLLKSTENEHFDNLHTGEPNRRYEGICEDREISKRRVEQFRKYPIVSGQGNKQTGEVREQAEMQSDTVLGTADYVVVSNNHRISVYVFEDKGERYGVQEQAQYSLQ